MMSPNLRTCDAAKNVLSSYVYVFIYRLVPSIVSIGDYSRVPDSHVVFIYRSGKGKLGSRKWKLDQSDGFFVQFESPAALGKIWFVTGTKEKPPLWSP